MEAEAPQAHQAEVAPAEEEVHPTEAHRTVVEEAHPAVEEAPAVDHPVEAVDHPVEVVDHPVEVSLPEEHPVGPLPEDRILHVTIGALAPARGTPVPARGTLEAPGVQTRDIHQLKATKDQRIMDTPRIPRHIQSLMDTAPAPGKV